MNDTESFQITVTGLEPTLGIARDGDGFKLIVDGPLNADYELEFSATLKPEDWENLLNFRLLTSPFEYTDDEGGGQTARFYRLRLVE